MTKYLKITHERLGILIVHTLNTPISGEQFTKYDEGFAFGRYSYAMQMLSIFNEIQDTYSIGFDSRFEKYVLFEGKTIVYKE